DFDALMNYIAVMAWLGPYDDYFQNHFFYRGTDGRWMIIPWDLENQFGGSVYVPATASFYAGETGDRSNRVDAGVTWHNDFKDAFIKAYRDKLDARLMQLSANQLATDAVYKMIAAAAAAYISDEAAQSPTGLSCPVTKFVSQMKTY